MGCGPGTTADTTDATTIEGPTGEVTWIDDGDTIEVKTTGGTLTVRLVATNAPDQGECFADDARKHLIETLKGETVHLQVMGVDQFDRTLAYVYDGGRNVNLEMVAAGYSLASTPGDEDPHGGSIPEAEQQAYQEGKGLWASDACGTTGAIPDVRFEPDSSEVNPAGDDSLDLAGEYVSITNHESETISLAGWLIRDESTRHRYRFAAGVEIEPGETLRIPSDDDGWDPGDSPVWNNGGDLALVQLRDGTVVDRWRY